MTLEALKQVLEAFGHGPVFYGGVPKRAAKELSKWDYVVFGRANSDVKQRTDISDKYHVAVIAENYIPEGLIETLIASLNALPGIRIPDQTVGYDYVQKPDASAVVEMASFVIVTSRKQAI